MYWTKKLLHFVNTSFLDMNSIGTRSLHKRSFFVLSNVFDQRSHIFSNMSSFSNISIPFISVFPFFPHLLCQLESFASHYLYDVNRENNLRIIRLRLQFEFFNSL